MPATPLKSGRSPSPDLFFTGLSRDMKTLIYAHDLHLEEADNDRLATADEYMLADRCVGSIFEGLEPGQTVVLAEGEYVLDKDLDIEG